MNEVELESRNCVVFSGYPWTIMKDIFRVLGQYEVIITGCAKKATISILDYMKF